MKVAVIGGGTAGYIACVHLTKEHPQFDLYHIYDPNIPPIGVGEGTTPDFTTWLHRVTGVDFETLQTDCHVTKKYAIQFENWGHSQHKQFLHNFYPVNQKHAYHISANKLVGSLLQEHVTATHIDKKVVRLDSSWAGAEILFEDQTTFSADLVFDARGFPKQIDNQLHDTVGCIPTSAALVCSGPPVSFNHATRSVARPHGWIFVIPLMSRTSYGYVFNRDITPLSEIEADLEAFLMAEGVSLESKSNGKLLHFPNFVQRTFFDGSVFKIGNAASFVEPLEATSIHFTLAQMRVASSWPLGLWSLTQRKGKKDEINLARINRYLSSYYHRIALFIGWHYAQGSQYDSKFWRFAQDNFQRELQRVDRSHIVQDFERFLDEIPKFANPMTEPDLFTQQMGQNLKEEFALFPSLSFAEIGHGIGYTHNLTQPMQQPLGQSCG